MLSRSSRNTLLSMANNASQIKQTQFKMSSGRKFDSVLEGGSDYLKARGYQKNVNSFLDYKQEIDTGLSMIRGSLEGLKSQKTMIQQMQSLVEEAENLQEADRGNLTTQVQNLSAQADSILGDARIGGVSMFDREVSGGELHQWNKVGGLLDGNWFDDDPFIMSDGVYEVGYRDDVGEGVEDLSRWDGKEWKEIVQFDLTTGLMILGRQEMVPYGQ
ncbi:MAG: flagellin [Alphaproteobacteria bacterium]